MAKSTSGKTFWDFLDNNKFFKFLFYIVGVLVLIGAVYMIGSMVTGKPVKTPIGEVNLQQNRALKPDSSTKSDNVSKSIDEPRPKTLQEKGSESYSVTVKGNDNITAVGKGATVVLTKVYKVMNDSNHVLTNSIKADILRRVDSIEKKHMGDWDIYVVRSGKSCDLKYAQSIVNLLTIRYTEQVKQPDLSGFVDNLPEPNNLQDNMEIFLVGQNAVKIIIGNRI